MAVTEMSVGMLLYLVGKKHPLCGPLERHSAPKARDERRDRRPARFIGGQKAHLVLFFACFLFNFHECYIFFARISGTVTLIHFPREVNFFVLLPPRRPRALPFPSR